jgi:hypothetical protein
MADRPTSHAKSVEGLHREESALDRARALREQFDRAQKNPQQQNQKATEAEKPGSPMVQADALVLRPTPSGPMRQGPDRQAHATNLSRERDEAAARQAAIERAQALRDRQPKTPDRDRER